MKRLLLLLGVCLFVSNAKAQIRDYYDDRVFYYDDYGWSVALSLGTVLYGDPGIYFSDPEPPTLGKVLWGTGADSNGNAILLWQTELKETLLPSFTLTGEYKPYKDLSFDTGLTYFSHDLEIVPSDNANNINRDGGSIKKLIWFVGGNYNFDELLPRITPYVTADFGLALNFANIKLKTQDSNTSLIDESGTALSSAAQTGAGFDVNVGPLRLGLLYNYILTGDYTVTLPLRLDESSQPPTTANFDFDSLGGHKIELKGTIKPSILNN